MKSRQFSIGEFASMNKVSTRMLRHYDKIGLLHPADILPNGYRCYSEKQIDVISQIKRLRGCGFLLEEIGQILQNNSPLFLAEEAKRKLLELQGQAAWQQTAMQALSDLTQEYNTAVSPSIYGVSLSTRQKSNILMPNLPVTLETVEETFDTLFHLLSQKKIPITGCALLINRLDCQTEDQNQVGVPISNPYRDQSYQTLILPSASVLCVIHYGDYYSIGHAYNALFDYAEQHCYPIGNTFMERYFIDSSHGASPNEYVTELSVALKH